MVLLLLPPCRPRRRHQPRRHRRWSASTVSRVSPLAARPTHRPVARCPRTKSSRTLARATSRTSSSRASSTRTISSAPTTSATQLDNTSDREYNWAPYLTVKTGGDLVGGKVTSVFGTDTTGQFTFGYNNKAGESLRDSQANINGLGLEIEIHEAFTPLRRRAQRATAVRSREVLPQTSGGSILRPADSCRHHELQGRLGAETTSSKRGCSSLRGIDARRRGPSTTRTPTAGTRSSTCRSTSTTWRSARVRSSAPRRDVSQRPRPATRPGP